MKNDDDFVNEYISECIDRGIKTTKDICNEARKEMDSIDKKLIEANKLRIRFKNLKQVLKNFNHESVRKNRTNDHTVILNQGGDITKSFFYEVMIKICDYIDSSESPFTTREIANHVSGIENASDTFLCIKELADNGIILRNEERQIIKGPKWNERPQLLNNKTA